MKKAKQVTFQVILVTLALISGGFSSPQKNTYNELMDFAGAVKIINTHEHQRNPAEMGYENYNFWVLLANSYLMADMITAGADKLTTDLLNSKTPGELWDENGNFLSFCSQTSYYGQFLEGFKKCYGYNEKAFTKDGIERLSHQIESNYRNYPVWFDSCFKQAGFETMLIDQHWSPLNLNVNEKYFTLVLPVNQLVNNIGRAREVFTPNNKTVANFTEATGVKTINTLDEYLMFADFILQSAIKHGAVALKNSMAYSRTIYYENTPGEVADELYGKSNGLTASEHKALQDFMFHWFLDKAAEYNLTVQIHTGYMAGNGNRLENGNPANINNLFLEHPKTRFDIFHGGFPWTGEFTALGKMFPNVYLNLVWLPQISKERAKITFNEMLDCVPYNKILWGGDCHFIEEAVGSHEFGKQVVCEVLAERISGGQTDEATAKKIISAVFRENAINCFPRLKIENQ